MARPKINFNEHRELLTELFLSGLHRNTILQIVRNDLNLQCSRATLYRQFQSWGLSSRPQTEHSPQLYRRIQELFRNHNLTDQQIYNRLEAEQYPITLTAVTKIRRCFRLLRRQTIEQQQLTQERLWTFLIAERQRDPGWFSVGKEMLYIRLRQQGWIISRDAAFQVYRSVFPETVLSRRSQVYARRGGWTVPGPDFIWSMDSYAKLRDFGIEIYAAIDAYSRYIVFAFVGLSAFTQRSTVQQFVDTIDRYRYVPLRGRSDHGREAEAIAAVLFYLSRSRRITDDHGNERPLAPKDTWAFVKSTINVKIESWWSRMSKACILFWRVRLISPYQS